MSNGIPQTNPKILPRLQAHSPENEMGNSRIASVTSHPSYSTGNRSVDADESTDHPGGSYISVDDETDSDGYYGSHDDIDIEGVDSSWQ